MWIKKKEPSSGNLMTQKASFENTSKTYHDIIYTEKTSFFLDTFAARGFNNRRSHERNILCKKIS
jgi:hypothetical protein